MNLLMLDGNSDFVEDSPMEISEAILVSTAKSGDTNAFVELSRRHSPKLLADDLSNHQELARCGRCAPGFLAEGFLSFARFPGEIQFLHLAYTDRDQLSADDLAQEAPLLRNLNR